MEGDGMTSTVNVIEAAKLLKVTRQTIYNMIYSGVLEYQQVSLKYPIYITLDEINRHREIKGMPPIKQV